MISTRPPITPESRWEMKRACEKRDGLESGCYWCGTPFPSLYAATLEHITPLADGGKHELENCALSCGPCNVKNVPKSVLVRREIARRERARRAAQNRIANGGSATPPSPNIPPKDCPPLVSSCFAAIRRERQGKLLRDFGDASFVLQALHKRLGMPHPTKNEVRIFRGHFNRCVHYEAENRITYPVGYVNPFA